MPPFQRRSFPFRHAHDRFTRKMRKENVRRHEKKMAAHIEPSEGEGTAPVAATRVIGAQRTLEQRVHRPAYWRVRRGQLAGGQHFVGNGRAEKAARIAKRVEQGPLQVQFGGAAEQSWPEDRIRAEMAQQQVNVVEVRRPRWNSP